MVTHGVAREDYVCAICEQPVPTGSDVYHDITKREGKHIVHKACYDDLVQTRGRKSILLGTPKVSPTRLDPPF